MKWNAYHFVGDTLRDGSPIPENGVTLYHRDKLELCTSGFHASRKAHQALMYAPGVNLCRVYSGGRIIESGNKLVSMERTIISRVDLTETLYEYARWCASSVLHLWEAPLVVRDYLDTGNEQIKVTARMAAWNAARMSAESAARMAAKSAAESAARSAAVSAARGAAESAARMAAWNAAKGAAWNAARGAAESAARMAAWNAAWGAAWNAAKEKQNQVFDKMVEEAFERS